MEVHCYCSLEALSQIGKQQIYEIKELFLAQILAKKGQNYLKR